MRALSGSSRLRSHQAYIEGKRIVQLPKEGALAGNSEVPTCRSFNPMSLDRAKFDSTLFAMLQQHSDEIDFLNTMFGFLQRKTACFNGPNAEKNFGILIQTLQAQLVEYKRQTAPESAEAFASAKAAAKQRETAPSAPATTPAAAPPKVQKVEEKQKPAAAPAPAPAPAPASASKVPSSGGAAASTPADGDDSKDEGPRPKLPGNGGRTEKYSWTQTLQEVSVSIPVPAGVTSKMLSVKIQSKNIEVAIKGGDTIVSGALHASVQLDECLWLLDKNCVDVTLSKVCFLLVAFICVSNLRSRVLVRSIKWSGGSAWSKAILKLIPSWSSRRILTCRIWMVRRVKLLRR